MNTPETQPGRLAASDPDAGTRAAIRLENGILLVALGGRLDAVTVARLWPDLVGKASAEKFSELRIEGSGIGYCDGTGIGLLTHLEMLGRARGATVKLEGLPPGITDLLERATPKASLEPPARKPGFVEGVGIGVSTVAKDTVVLIAFLGETVSAFAWALTHPRRVRWRDVLLVCERTGANAVPVTCLLGFLMGLIIAFQTAAPLARYGAESQIPVMMAYAMIRELGPLTTAIILAGRSGSAFAAEIGTMKVTEEINALTTFGLDPVRFLVVPRVLAAMLMTPLLANFCTLMGLLGGVPPMLSFGYSASFYLDGVRLAVGPHDFLQGVFKSIVFAFVVGAVGCQRGLSTASGPGAVGNSTTSAVVAGIVLIVVVDGVMGVVFYCLGV